MDNSSRIHTTKVRTMANTRTWTAWASRCIKKVWRASSQLWRPPQIKCPTTLPQNKTSMVSSKKRTLASLNPLLPMKRLQLTQMARLLQPVIKRLQLMHRPRHKQTMLRMVDKRHPRLQSNNKMNRRTIHLPSSEYNSSLLRKFNNQAAYIFQIW